MYGVQSTASWASTEAKLFLHVEAPSTNHKQVIPAQRQGIITSCFFHSHVLTDLETLK